MSWNVLWRNGRLSVGAYSSRLARRVAVAAGVAVIFGSLAGGIALANASGHGSTNAIVVADASSSPGQGDDDQGKGTQSGDDHNAASPGASCHADADDMVGASARPTSSQHESDDSHVGATPRPSSSMHEADDAVHATSSPKPSTEHDSDGDAECDPAMVGHDD
jgi:hypothetical protein